MDKFTEALGQVYGWRVSDDGEKVVPPYLTYKLPDFVIDRIEWLSNEAQENGMLTLPGAVHMLIDIDNEDKLKDDWEMGALSEYMPVTKEYREWLNAPIYDNYREIAVAIAYIYWQGNNAKTEDKDGLQKKS